MSINGTREFLLNHRTSVLYLTIGFFFVIASLRLGYETWRIVLDTSESGANDLLTFKNQLHLWFSGIPVYTEQVKAPYPPASWMIFWPLIAQIDWPAIRWIWAAILVPVLALLVYIIIFESGSNSRIEKVAITLFILAIYPTVIVIGNGQFTLHILLSLIASILLLHRNNNKWVSFSLLHPYSCFHFSSRQSLRLFCGLSSLDVEP